MHLSNVTLLYTFSILTYFEYLQMLVLLWKKTIYIYKLDQGSPTYVHKHPGELWGIPLALVTFSIKHVIAYQFVKIVITIFC